MRGASTARAALLLERQLRLLGLIGLIKERLARLSGGLHSVPGLAVAPRGSAAWRHSSSRTRPAAGPNLGQLCNDFKVRRVTLGQGCGALPSGFAPSLALTTPHAPQRLARGDNSTAAAAAYENYLIQGGQPQ